MSGAVRRQLRIGDLCRLNSGSPILTVVDFDGDTITVAWPTTKGRAVETTFSRAVLTPTPGRKT